MENPNGVTITRHLGDLFSDNNILLPHLLTFNDRFFFCGALYAHNDKHIGLSFNLATLSLGRPTGGLLSSTQEFLNFAQP